MRESYRQSQQDVKEKEIFSGTTVKGRTVIKPIRVFFPPTNGRFVRRSGVQRAPADM